MHLVFLPVNQRYVFILGTVETVETASMVRLDGEPLLFEWRKDAAAAAARKGLIVDFDGTVR